MVFVTENILYGLTILFFVGGAAFIILAVVNCGGKRFCPIISAISSLICGTILVISTVSLGDTGKIVDGYRGISRSAYLLLLIVPLCFILFPMILSMFVDKNDMAELGDDVPAIIKDMAGLFISAVLAISIIPLWSLDGNGLDQYREGNISISSPECETVFEFAGWYSVDEDEQIVRYVEDGSILEYAYSYSVNQDYIVETETERS